MIKKWILASLVFLLVFIRQGMATVPQPMCTLYGQARDSFGWPYLADAEVILSVNGIEINRCAINGLLAPGVNFVLRAPLDSGGTSSYSESAVTNGSPFQIRILVHGVEESVIQYTNLTTVGAPGSISYLTVTAGTDLDGDGLPDDWEYWMADFSWSDDIWSPIDVHAGDDFDGDGVSNLQEFLAGTDPAWNEDFFAMENLEQTLNGRLRVEIFTVPGKSYRVIRTDAIGGAWAPVKFAISPAGGLDNDYLVGDGYYWSVYVDWQTDGKPAGFYRFTAE